MTNKISDKYTKKYGEAISIAANELNRRFKYNWRDEDTVAFGKASDNWATACEIMESDQTTNGDLGAVLNQNLGLVTMQYSTLPIQNIASVQPLDDISGSVFYRTAIATTSRAGVNEGDQLMSAYGKTNSNINSYMSDHVTVTADFQTSTLEYTVQMGQNVTPGSVAVQFGTIKAIDDGEGHLVGVNIDGADSTINYKSGQVKVKALADGGLTEGGKITFSCRQDIVSGRSVPSFKWSMLSKNVTARFYVLQSTYNTLSSFQVKKKFGADTGLELASDLVSQSNAAVMNDTINNLVDGALEVQRKYGKSITWSKSAPSGVSEVAFRQNFDDVIIEAVDSMSENIGRGNASFFVVNTIGKQILKSLGMTILNDSNTVGVVLCGYYDGAPVYYAANTKLAKNEILVGYRGSNFYESAVAYCPYMPLTNEVGSGRDNVFEKMSGIASASGNECLVPEFSVMIKVI